MTDTHNRNWIRIMFHNEQSLDPRCSILYVLIGKTLRGRKPMTEFETTLKEYRKLVEQIADERGFLDFLQGQLTEVEEKLKSLAAPIPQPGLSFNIELPLPAPSSQPDGNDSLPALEEAARAVEFLGNGVIAEQLAKHLDISRDAARLRLQRAARVGLIARMGVGRYRAIRQSPAHTKGRVSANGTEPHEKTDGPDDDAT